MQNLDRLDLLNRCFIQGKEYIGYVICLAGNAQIFVQDSDGVHSYIIDDIKTINKSTGLKDKNGKLIFEGDVLLYDTHAKYEDKDDEKNLNNLSQNTSRFSIFYITEGLNGWWIKMIEDNGGKGKYYDSFDYYFSENFSDYEILHECEIIGNIYQNPELLKNN